MASSSRSGRKQFDGKNIKVVLRKLEEAFMLGGTDEEASIYAGISTSALYEYQKKNPAFLERKQALKNLPTLRAKKAIVNQLEKDISLAKWWLTKKCRSEFGDYIPVVTEKIDLVGEAKRRSAKYATEASESKS